MKIGVISDIHGNHYALGQVLKVAHARKVDHLLVLGDVVGYYYHPDIVLELLSQWDYTFIRGNHEVLFQRLLAGNISEESLRTKYGSGHRLAVEKLSTTEKDSITEAPDWRMVTFDGTRILMCHGSPWDPDFYLYPDTDAATLKKCDTEDCDFVVTGHSHYSFVFRNQHSLLINAGSVGQSRSVGGVAFWSIINTGNKAIEMMATPYDTTALVSEARSVDPGNPYLHEILNRNRN